MDTLIGLSIQYGVPENKIRAYNNLQNDEIYYKKEIKIPNPQTNFGVEHTQMDYEEMIKHQKIQYFKLSVLKPQDSSDKVSRYYLEEAEWDSEKAEKLYREDLEWEAEQKKMQPYVKVDRANAINKIFE